MAASDESSIDKEGRWERARLADAGDRRSGAASFYRSNGREEPVLGTPEAATQDREEFAEESYSPRAYASDKAELRQNTIAWTFAWALGKRSNPAFFPGCKLLISIVPSWRYAPAASHTLRVIVSY